MARLLVTGGAGFIGANFVHYWLREHPGERVVVLDSMTYAGSLARLQEIRNGSDFRFVKGNICDRELVEHLLREERVDTLVHFAAESHVDRSIRRPDTFIETNIVGTHSVLAAARAVWLDERRTKEHRFHHISTDEVYGTLGPEDPPFDEHTPYAPNSPYSASKAASDHLVRAYHHTYGLKVTTSNCSNNYGPYQLLEKLVPLMLANILDGRPLPVYGDGRQIRDWLHVSDHCRAIDCILRSGRPGEVYNIGGRSECANLDLVLLLCQAADELLAASSQMKSKYPNSPASRGLPSSSLIEFVTDRPGHDRRYAINCNRIEQELSFVPSISLQRGLSETLLWYVHNEWWWRSVMDDDYEQWMRVQYGSSLRQ